jgi:hypothetical protein
MLEEEPRRTGIVSGAATIRPGSSRLLGTNEREAWVATRGCGYEAQSVLTCVPASIIVVSFSSVF